jgi:hypothetical protein
MTTPDWGFTFPRTDLFHEALRQLADFWTVPAFAGHYATAHAMAPLCPALTIGGTLHFIKGNMPDADET